MTSNYEVLEVAASTRKRLGQYISGRRAYKLLKKITMYHRIQGSLGLRQAVEAVERTLVDEAPDIIEVTSYSYTGKTGPEWLPLPTRWNVYDAVLEVNGNRYRFEEHPTLPAAHTPPTDGVVEGEIVEVKDPLDGAEYEKNKDKIILIKNHHRIAYRLAAESGVAGVILAMKERHREAFPYIGLFLTPQEAEKYSTPAVTIPWNIAEELPGKTARIRIDADIGGYGEVPVLIAWIGDPQGSGPALLAHICHPRPGANDNASGVAAALEAFIAIAESLEGSDLNQPDATIRLILMPEYSGTVLLLEGWMSNLEFSGLNLDMVGRKGGLAQPPRLTYAPLTIGPSKIGDTYYDVTLLEDSTPAIDYYMAGSDHDALLGYGRDSVMVNQWPDPYYHTDMDEADTIDPNLLAAIATRASTTVYLAATDYTPTGLARRRVAERLASKNASKQGGVSLALMTLSLRYDIPEMRIEASWTPVRDDRSLKASQPFYTGLLSPKISLDEKVRIARMTEGIRVGYNVFNEAIFGARREYTVSRLHTELAAAYSMMSSEETFYKVLEILEEAGILEIS
jgi:aminopeptidase YwaD